MRKSIKERYDTKPKRWLAILLTAVMLFSAAFGLLPGLSPLTVHAAPGDSSADPVLVTTYAGFKSALENPSVTYIRVTKNIEHRLAGGTDHVNNGAAISVRGNKVLQLDAHIKIHKTSLDGILLFSFIHVPSGAKLELKGLGSITCGFNANNNLNGVIYNNGTLEVSDVTLDVGLALSAYGRAIVNAGGNTVIHSGTFKGVDARPGTVGSGMEAVYVQNGDLTVYGGNFSASKIGSSTGETFGLTVDKPKTSQKILLAGGTFAGIHSYTHPADPAVNISAFLASGASLVNAASGTSVSANTGKITQTVRVNNPSAVKDITITGVTLPVAGAAPSTSGITVPSGQGYSIRTDGGYAPKWYYNGSAYTSNFVSGNTYEIVVTIAAGAGKTLGGANATINGKKAKVVHTGSYCTVSCEYTATGGALIKVGSAAITGAAIPIDGEKPAFGSPYSDAPEKYSVTVFQWWDYTAGSMMTTEKFIGGQYYALFLRLNIRSGYTFLPSPYPDVTVNGLPANFVEAQGADLIYIIQYYATGDNEISFAAVEITIPAAGKPPGFSAISDDPVKYDAFISGWYDETAGIYMTSSDVFVAGQKYTCTVGLHSKSGYWFSRSPRPVVMASGLPTAYSSGGGVYLYYDITFTAGAAGVTNLGGQSLSITAPVTGAAPQSAITAGTGYTGAITWSGSPASFAAGTAYTATVTLTSAAGYKWPSVPSPPAITVPGSESVGYYAVNGGDVSGNKLTFEVVFPITSSAAPTYTVAVTNGTGGGSFAAGATVNITADTPPKGMRFKNWTAAPTVAFANANNASASFPMPAGNVTVTANFEGIRGDANCDGNVNAADAAAILRTLVELQTLTPQGRLNAKVTFSSGAFSAADAAKILRWLVDLEPVL